MAQAIVALSFIGLWIAGIVGWIMNIVTVFHMPFDTLNGELVLRLVGIFVAPIGAILGYL